MTTDHIARKAADLIPRWSNLELRMRHTMVVEQLAQRAAYGEPEYDGEGLAPVATAFLRDSAEAMEAEAFRRGLLLKTRITK